MNTNLIILLAPVVCALSFFLIERIVSARCLETTSSHRRTFVILGIALLNQCLAIMLSALFLLPLALLLAPFQLFSISDWQVPIPVSLLLSLLLLDAGRYLDHRLHHAIPWLWRVHRLHHADSRPDALTSLTHHPFEIVLTFFTPVVVAVLFDVPVIAMVIYGFLVALQSPLTHLTSTIPDSVEKYLSWIFVTSNFHRIHHALDPVSGNSNFGNLFTLWDRLFSTATHQKNEQLHTLKFGITDTQPLQFFRFTECLNHPFK